MALTISDRNLYLATITFKTMNGPVHPSGPLMKDISQEGVAGAAFQRYGYRGQRFKVQTMAAYTSAVNLGLGKILHAQYQTRNIDLSDALGVTWSNLMVHTVAFVNEQRIMTGVGGLSGYTHILEAEWDLQSVAVGY